MYFLKTLTSSFALVESSWTSDWSSESILISVLEWTSTDTSSSLQTGDCTSKKQAANKIEGMVMNISY